MTNKEIVQALRCRARHEKATNEGCKKCPYWATENLEEWQKLCGWASCEVYQIISDAADAIERLTAENAELRKEIEWKDMVISLAQREQAKALDAADLIDRLTAENAELREKVYSMSGEWCAMMSVWNSMGSYDRLRELAEADKDGRVVVQPCNVGDKLYRVFAGEIFEHRVGSMKYFAIQGRWDIETYPFCPCVESSIGKTVFFTHEEAERALREIQGKEDADGTTDKPE